MYFLLEKNMMFHSIPVPMFTGGQLVPPPWRHELALLGGLATDEAVTQVQKRFGDRLSLMVYMGDS